MTATARLAAAALLVSPAKPLKELLRETIRRLREHPNRSASPGAPNPVDELSVALEILEGSTAHDEHLVLVREGKPVTRAEAVRHLVQSHAFPLLLDTICIVRVDGVRQELNLWSSRLAGYLYPRSTWIEDAFDGMQPPRGRSVRALDV